MNVMNAAPLTYRVNRSEKARTAAERDAILASPGFGLHFTDHMVAITWDKAQGWHDAEVRAYGPLSLDLDTADDPLLVDAGDAAPPHGIARG